MMRERLGYKNIFEAITDDPVEALELKIDSDRILIQRLQKERDGLKAKNDIMQDMEPIFMSLIKDCYSQSGKVSKKSGLAIMRYVAKYKIKI